MLNNETMGKLRSMRLTGIADALEEQEENSGYREMEFGDRLGLLVDREFGRRRRNRLQRLVNGANFANSSACVEDIRYDDDRRLDRNLVLELASCNYVRHARNVVITGPTGAGKSYLAQALGQSACRQLSTVKYFQLPYMLEEFQMAGHKGLETYNRLLKQLVKVDLLILDDWLLFPVSEEDTRLLLSLIDRRHNRKATIVASQYDPAEWLDQIPIAVAAEAITDRIASRAYRIVIGGSKSMRAKTFD